MHHDIAKLPKASGVYQIRNIICGKVYVGSAINLHQRQTQHFADLRSGRHFNRHLQSAWRRDGEAAFAFEVIEICAKVDTLQREQVHIDRLKACGHGGYNSRPRAESNLGRKHTPEQIEANRRAQTGRKQSAETIAKRTGGQKGRKLPPEWCAAIAAGKTGKPRPDTVERCRKFDDLQVTRIRALRADGWTLKRIATVAGCSIPTVHKVVLGAGVAYAIQNPGD